MEIERRYATESLCWEDRGLKPHGYNRFSLRERNAHSCVVNAIRLRRYGLS
jgi:hypothetical protein